MSKFFVNIYEYLSRKKILRNVLMFGSFVLLLLFAVQLRFEEEFTRFFPDNASSEKSEQVFQNLKVKDKIIVMVSSRDSLRQEELLDSIVLAGDRMSELIGLGVAADYLLDILSEVGGDVVDQTSDFLYGHLPAFLADDDYQRMDTLLTEDAIDQRMRQNLVNLMSPAGLALKSTIPRDPLGLGGNVMLGLKDFENISNYEIYDNHIFSSDLSTLLLILSPKYGTGETGKNEKLIAELEELSAGVEQEYPGVRVQFFGGPSVAVYNARQVKKDTYLTLGVALLIIIAFMSVMFKSRSAIPLLLTPVLYGGVFSLAMIFFIKGSISAIAIGVGAVVLGIALSYSIHVITHYNHVKSRRQLVEELSYPLVVGGFTTIGAFLSLLFTSSDMLRDFGLFSALSLVGTTLFCLIFLPHLLGRKTDSQTSRKALEIVGKITSYPFEKNKVLLVVIFVIFIAGLFTMGNVKFDSDMSNLNYEPASIKEAEKKMNRLFMTGDRQQVMFVSVGETVDEALQNYAENNQILVRLKTEGKIRDFVSSEKLMISPQQQQERIRRWNDFWTPDRKQWLKTEIRESGAKYGFSPDAFEPFFSLLDKEFLPFSPEELGENIPFLADWVVSDGNSLLCITQVQLSDSQKDFVYDTMGSDPDLVIFDRAFFINKWVSVINDDFNTILFLSSLIIFLALLISYGRFELTLMAFAPMAISWVIILGLMAIFGIEFNIINIILSTFIFGLGDDFSIFMMDGMQQEYRTGKKLVDSHKIAILFSAFTATVGMGVLIFAKHPALKSISLISILGMMSVLLVSYTVIPVLFRTFITRPARKGNYPYTLFYLVSTALIYVSFVLGSLLLFIVRLLLALVPIPVRKKKALFSRMIMYSTRLFLFLIFYTRKKIINDCNEDLKKQAVIVANHQSMIDILIMLSLSPKIVMVTNRWVWNSPVFGHVVRYAGFISTQKGFENMGETLREKVADGYSVVVFPEGTRSADGKIKRFHKGAFMLAESLQLDIVPIVIYGTGQILNKRQMFYVKPGTYGASFLPRIPAEKLSEYGSAHDAAKAVKNTINKEYYRLQECYDRPENLYFRHKLVQNYVYKGPVEEWYVRVKSAMEKYYAYFERIIPRSASVVDVGCGYGMLAYMLSTTSAERRVLGIDYDEDKIAIANHNFSKTAQLRFDCTDALEYDYPSADVFVVNDMLHYMDYRSQEILLEKCVEKINDNGMIIVRDSDADRNRGHKVTRFTEMLSTRFFKFNKTEQQLQFPTAKQFEVFAQKHGLDLERHSNDKLTSNQVFIFRKKEG
ncbi:1-acyl-sn-glycerol-3-phosphate acyltransferases [Porphyromonadaceae bacterium NLAE-zl-C104]|nr:1-acyl-sn-glycerol-3-phosphate acyltransferases [Porphyromonadaceae bacterium NLAE-zl-C104]